MFDAVLEADDGLDQVLQQEVCFVTQEETIKLAFLTHAQCDQMAKVIFNIGPFTKWKYAQNMTILPKSGAKFLH